MDKILDGFSFWTGFMAAFIVLAIVAQFVPLGG